MTEKTFDELYSDLHSNSRRIESAEKNKDYDDALQWAEKTKDSLLDIIVKIKAIQLKEDLKLGM